MKSCNNHKIFCSARESPLRNGRDGFTLIELLVAMSILMIIVAIVGQIFQQANVAWSTGLKSVETTMKGRSVAELIAQELSQAIVSPTHSTFTVNGSGADFWMLGEASATNTAAREVIYDWSGTTVSRDTVPLAEGIDKVDVKLGPVSAAIPLPPYVTVTVTVSSNSFQAKAYLHHRERYLY